MQYQQLRYRFIPVVAIFITCVNCQNRISFVPETVKQITLGKQTLYLNFVVGGGEARNTGLVVPLAITVDIAGNMYVVDGNRLGIIQYSSTGLFVKRIELEGESARLFRPIALDMDQEGSIFLMDVHANRRWRKRIHIMSPLNRLLSTKELPYYFADFIYCDGALFFSTYGEKRSKLIVKTPISGSDSTEFGDMYPTDSPQLHFIKNQVNICLGTDRKILVAYTFLPKVKIFSSNGDLIRAFEFEDHIQNKKDPLNFITPVMPESRVGGFGTAEFNVETFPICYDIAMGGQDSVCLLVPTDHSKPERRAVVRYDYSGKFIDRGILPFSCNKLFIDSEGNYYFIGVNRGKLILKYKSI